jgi:hypothetical protein
VPPFELELVTPSRVTPPDQLRDQRGQKPRIWPVLYAHRAVFLRVCRHVTKNKTKQIPLEKIRAAKLVLLSDCTRESGSENG